MRKKFGLSITLHYSVMLPPQMREIHWNRWYKTEEARDKAFKRHTTTIDYYTDRRVLEKIER